MKKIINRNTKGLALLLGFLGSYLFVSPYVSIWIFKKAIDNKNTDLAMKYIDFKSLRNSLKIQLISVANSRAEKEFRNQPFYEIKLMLINPIVNTVIDKTVNATVTPNGLETLLNQGELTKENKNKVDQRNYNYEINNNTIQKKDNQINLYYSSLNKFILSSQPSMSEEPVKAIWKRYRINTWKLHSIELPSSILNKI